MKICFDLRCLQMGHESRGVGMHVKNLLEHLPVQKDIQYIMYAFDSGDPIKDLGITMRVPYELIQTKSIKKSISSPQDFLRLARIIWHRYKPLRITPPDIFIQFDFMLGLPKLTGTKTALFAYDLIPLIFKQEYLPSALSATTTVKGFTKKIKRGIRAVYYRWRYRLHYKNFSKADMILSISHYTKDSLVEILGVAADKIKVTPLAPSLRTHNEQRPADLPRKIGPFIFYIGGTDNRKRIADLIRAFESIRQNSTEVSLLLVGKEFEDVNKIPNDALKDTLLSSPSRSNIYTLGYVTDSEKLWLYSHAVAFVFPTAFEGFGLPIVEAMAGGCPVIAYDNSSVPEVAGGAAILVPTGDTAALSSAITDIVSNNTLREKIITTGLKQGSYYTWGKHAKLLFEALAPLT